MKGGEGSYIRGEKSFNDDEEKRGDLKELA